MRARRYFWIIVPLALCVGLAWLWVEWEDWAVDRVFEGEDLRSNTREILRAFDEGLEDRGDESNPLDGVQETDPGAVDVWSGLELLEDGAISWAKDGMTGNRARLVRHPDFDVPIRVEERWVRPGLNGEPRLDRTVGMVANRLIVKVRQGVEYGLIVGAFQQGGVEDLETLNGSSTVVLSLQSQDLDTVPEALEILKNPHLNPVIEYAEPDYIVHAAGFSNDPSLNDGGLWGLHNEGGEGGVDDVDIDAIEGWDIATDAGDLVVGVIDTGVRYTHEDLADNMWVNPNEIAGNEIDDDGNGYVDDVHGINATLGTGDPFDDNGHGTHVAGTIGGVGDNGLGIVGVAWRTQIMALKFLRASGSGTISDAVRCMDYATQQGVFLTNNSWGGGGYSEAFSDALDRAREAGVLFVAASGNNGIDIDEDPHYPAAYEQENVLSVGSVDRDGELSSFSNYGLESVDIVAPGRDILSAWHSSDQSYRIISGTSMASPHAAGILTLQGAAFPEVEWLKQKERLLVASQLDERYVGQIGTGGLVNLGNALALADLPDLPRFLERPRRSTLVKEGDALRVAVDVESESEVVYRWFFEGELLPDEVGDELLIAIARPFNQGEYHLEVENAVGTRSTVFRVEVSSPEPTLSAAADDINFPLFSRGDGDWSVYRFDGVEGGTSVRSIGVNDGRSGILFSDVEGPGALAFDWRVSSEAGRDFGRVSLDGSEVGSIDGETTWQRVNVELDEARLYRIEWEYRKDNNRAEGDDSLYVDRIQFVPSGEARPRVLKHPEDLIASVGGQASFQIEAVGGSLMYQWFNDGEMLPGEDSSELLISEARASDEGVYYAEISNGNGVTTSLPALLEVGNIEVTILEDPEGGLFDLGSEVSLEALARGTYPIEYRWYHNGLRLEGETNSELLLENLGEEAGGEYWVEVVNAYTSEPIRSSSAIVEVERIQISPRFVKQPRFTFAKEGQAAGLHAVAEGLQPIDYQWFKNGRALVGETGFSLLIDAGDISAAGEYSVSASNVFGKARSERAELVVLSGIEEAVDSEGIEFALFGDAYLESQNEVSFDGEDALVSRPSPDRISSGYMEAVIEGSGVLSFRWKRGETFTNGFELILEIDGVAARLSDDGDWNFVLRELGEGTHTVRWNYLVNRGFLVPVYLDTLSFDKSPVVQLQPKRQIVELGDSATFEVEGLGGQVAYQWFHNGRELIGETSKQLIVEEVGYLELGEYKARLTNDQGESWSQGATLQFVDSYDSLLGEGRFSLGGSVDWERVWKRGAGWVHSYRHDTNGSNWIETQVRGPGYVSFSVEGSGICNFGLDTKIGDSFVRVFRANEREPNRRFIRIPEGEHTLRFEFETFCFFGSGFGESDIWDIRIDPRPLVYRQPEGVNAFERHTILLDCLAAGNSEIAYQWYQDGELLEGASDPNLMIRGAARRHSGWYTCRLTDDVGNWRDTQAVWVEVRPDPGHALSRLGIGEVAYGNSLNWEETDEGRDQKEDALRWIGAGEAVSDYVEFEFTKEQFGGGRVQRLWLKSQLNEGDRLRVYKNGMLVVEILDTRDWFAVEVETLDSGVYSIRVEIEREAGAEDSKLWIGPLVVYQAPELRGLEANRLELGRSSYLVMDYETSAESEFVWKKDGEVLDGDEEGIRILRDGALIESLDYSDEGLYEVSLENELGVDEGRFRVHVTNRFGHVVDSPNLWVRPIGSNFWFEDAENKMMGDASLTTRLETEGGECEIAFLVPSDREVSLNLLGRRLRGGDRVQVYMEEALEEEFVGEFDWTKLELFNSSRESNAEVRIRIEWDAGGDENRSVSLDGVRIRKSTNFNYTVWAFESFDFDERQLAEISGPFADPDDDGLPNFVEYAFDLDPLVPSSPPRLGPLPELGEGVGEGEWTGYFRAETFRERPDVEVWLQEGESNARWLVLPQGGGYKRESDGHWSFEIEGTLDSTESGRDFLRVNVEYIPEA
ncbi:MAG: S8 family serine peptidase [Verrucomicrobiota bacterium]